MKKLLVKSRGAKVTAALELASGEVLIVLKPTIRYALERLMTEVTASLSATETERDFAWKQLESLRA